MSIEKIDSTFVLHPQLENDTFLLASLPLCELMLMNDSNYPWIILVPRRVGLTELVGLSTDEQQLFLLESNAVSQLLQTRFSAFKLNVAALGNIVSQLHIHHIARFENDASWPKPIWGVVAVQPYTESLLAQTIELIKVGLEDAASFDFDWAANS